MKRCSAIVRRCVCTLSGCLCLLAASAADRAADLSPDAIVNGTHGYMPERYVAPAEPEVRAKLAAFRDLKLALMIHWGLYAQVGCHESWPLVDREAAWSRAYVDWAEGDAFKRQYLSLIRSFNPLCFDPAVWADVAARNGFRYVVFTTKHHDGFCLFDSKHSDFKVTSPACPFASDPRADVVRAVFDAFRARGLWISCYFSKPDWHHPDYWDNCGVGWHTTRMPSYDVTADSARWARFCAYTRSQILELVGGYGPIDVLWLDGGQVQRKTGLDIGIESIVAEARRIKPDLIVADRTAGGTCSPIGSTTSTSSRASSCTCSWMSSRRAATSLSMSRRGRTAACRVRRSRASTDLARGSAATGRRSTRQGPWRRSGTATGRSRRRTARCTPSC